MEIEAKNARGERPEFSTIYQEYFPRVYGFGCRLLGDSEQARDLTQEVFHKLFRRWDDRLRVRDIQGYLFRMAANLSTDWLRKERRFQKKVIRAAAPSANPGPDTAEVIIREEQVARARRALDALPVRARVLLGLYQDGLTYKEIARSAGVRPSSVGTLLARAIKRLADQVHQGETK